MERLGRNRSRVLTTATLRVWGMLFLIAGMISRYILQNRILNLTNITDQQLLDLLNSAPNSMAIATAALVLQALEVCAVPVFALLLVEGFLHTKNYGRYLLRVAAVALVSEIPYNLVTMDNWADMTVQNPCLALVIGLVMLYLFNRFSQRSAGQFLIRAFVVIAAVLWAGMLRIEHGTPIIAMVCVFWWMRNKANLRGLVGAGVAMCCCAVSPFYLVASMGCLPVHMYRGEQGERNKLVNYLAYPLLLIAVYLVGRFVF